MKNKFSISIGKVAIYVGLITALLLSISSIKAQDWPQYLGPDRNSTSPQKNLIRNWPAEGPLVLWSVDIGIGYGGPVVKDGMVYLLDRIDSIGDIMRSFDLVSGKEIWNFTVASPGTFPFPGSRSVPIVDDKNVYACGALGDLYCFDINSHKPIWSKNIWKDFGGGDIPVWAITQNPLIYKDMLIVASQAPDAGVVAYDKKNGTVKWKTPTLGNASYVSPSIVKINNEDQIVMVTPSHNPFQDRSQDANKGKIIGINPDNGNILWEYANWECHISVPSAFDAGNNKVMVTGGYELGVVMLKIDKTKDGKYNVTELFRHNDFGDQTKPPVMYNDHFYAQFSTNNKRDGLVCMNMEGKIMWKTGNKPLFNKGSMILANGLIFATDGANKLYLIEPDTTIFKPIASVDLLKEGGVDNRNRMTNFGGSTQNWAPMALADGKLLIRDQRRLICVKVAE